jgi:DNA mismatch repair ATPase MutS
MSGKTTFIRAFAINSIYSQALNISFSEKFESPFFKIFSSIRTQDDINKNTSFYLDEVLTVKDFIKSIKNDEPHLFILDEIFKGTNTLERIAIGKSVLSYLNQGNNFVFVSTHDLELADLLVNSDFDLYHFSEDVTNNSLTFNYKLKEGKLKTRNAIKILTLYEYPKEIINEANEIYSNSIKNKKDDC